MIASRVSRACRTWTRPVMMKSRSRMAGVMYLVQMSRSDRSFFEVIPDTEAYPITRPKLAAITAKIGRAVYGA